MESVREGGCACGAVRFKTAGEPVRVGLCHCLTCRKAHGSAFFPFVIFRGEQVALSGTTNAWESSPGERRLFCPTCGSRVADISASGVELSMGGFDEPGAFQPQYEAWTMRREPWLQPLPVPQHARNRSDG